MLPSSICHWPTRRCCRTSLLRIKAKYSTFLGRYPPLIQAGLGWRRMCSTGYISWSEYFPFLLMIDWYGPNQHELHISKLISGTTLWSHTSSHLWPPLWWKATEVTDNEPPDCVPWSIVQRVEGFHTEMSFLVCTRRLAAGSGLQQLLEVVFARNSVTHMLTGKTIARAVRGHFLADAVLNAELYRVRVATKCKTYGSVQTDYASVWYKNSGMLIISRIIRPVLRQIII